MGAWALSLFCCDYDLDLVQHFDEKCGLLALEAAAGRKPRDSSGSGSAREEEHRRIASKSESTVSTEDGTEAGQSMFEKLCSAAKSAVSAATGQALPINYSVFEKLCSDPVKVREQLDNTGILARVFLDLKRETFKVDRKLLRDPYGPGYHTCMLAACVMTLGAQLSEDNRAAVGRYYRSCGLMRDAVIQIEHALDPDTGYVNGCPWDFGIVGRDDPSAFHMAPKEDQLFPGLWMLNVWSPDHGRMKSEKWAFHNAILHTIAHYKPDVKDLSQCLASLMFDPYDTDKTRISSTMADSKPEKYRAEAERLVSLYDFHTCPAIKEHSSQTCGSCRVGNKLSKCGKCQEVYYCSRSCQKADFPKHKMICPLFARLKEEDRDMKEEWSAYAKEVKKRGG